MKGDWSAPLIGFALVGLAIFALWAIYSCEDSDSLKQLSGCKSPVFVDAAGTRHRTYYIYRCADGSLVKSSVLIAGDRQ